MSYAEALTTIGIAPAYSKECILNVKKYLKNALHL